MIQPNQIHRLHAALAAVCPIHGVSVETWGDPATVRIDHRDEATAQERAYADAVLAGFDWSAAAQTLYDTLAENGRAKEAMTGGDPTMRAVRNVLRLVYQSMLETRARLNDLAAAVNASHGTTFPPLVNRSWAQLLQAARQLVDAETDPGA